MRHKWGEVVKTGKGLMVTYRQTCTVCGLVSGLRYPCRTSSTMQRFQEGIAFKPCPPCKGVK